MSAVLGIDAAWTATEPTGVALVSQQAGGWQCVAMAPSYDEFVRFTDFGHVNWDKKPIASAPDAARLLAAASLLLHGAQVDVVAIDMPLAKVAIRGRRVADQEVSRAFGGQGCAVHTPSEERPGRIGSELMHGLTAAGYCLATKGAAPPSKAAIEVYPHVALLRLLQEKYRIPYKIGKAARYWREDKCTPAERRSQIFSEWRRILGALGKAISATPELRFEDSLPCRLKQYEDGIDALVCAWVGIKYLV
jgi:predicted RNase H-like nuclease